MATDKIRNTKMDMKIDSQMAMYNPFGRMGGGAPMRDETGHIIATRMGFFNENNNAVNNLALRQVSP